MTILILGNALDAHAIHVEQSLQQAGVPVVYWDTQLFPTQTKLSWQPETQHGYLTVAAEPPLDLQKIQAVFWRNFAGVSIPSFKDTDHYQIAFRDAISALRSIIQACPAHWVNSWQAYDFHQTKPLQLAKAKQLGVKIPATLISNDPEQITAFVSSHDKVIFKPVFGGAHTQFVTPNHVELERLRLSLRLAPVTVQEYISGTNIRSYVIGDAIYAAEIRSTTLDFREDPHAQLIPLTLPPAIQQQCLAIAQGFWLEWTAIDWRITPAGEYVFLEANPSPMFLHFERQTGFPITQALTQQLLQPPNRSPLS
jgi:glutathione synthase/RimK-type ligase-like ATP-grasp enzyme